MTKVYSLFVRIIVLSAVVFSFSTTATSQTWPQAANGVSTVNDTVAWDGGSSFKKVRLPYLPLDLTPATTTGNITIVLQKLI